MWISSKYRDADWARIRATLPADGSFAGVDPAVQWSGAIDIMRDRMDTRFVSAARWLTGHPHAGFVLLLVDSLVIEYLQRLRSDRLQDERASRELVSEFLRSHPRFQPHFEDGKHRERERACPCLACDFYRNVRSGVAHYAETRNDWLVRYGEPEMLRVENGAHVIDRNLFHEAFEGELEDYYRELTAPARNDLRMTLRRALDRVCGISATRE